MPVLKTLSKFKDRAGGFIKNKETLDIAKNVLIASLAGSAAVTGVNKAYDFTKLKVDQGNAYKKMFDKVPQLKEYDQSTVDDYYNVVKSFAPHMASNPYVVGSIVNKMILNEGVDHRLVGEISDISNNVSKPKNDMSASIMSASLKPFIPGSEYFYGKDKQHEHFGN